MKSYSTASTNNTSRNHGGGGDISFTTTTTSNKISLFNHVLSSSTSTLTMAQRIQIQQYLVQTTTTTTNQSHIIQQYLSSSVGFIFTAIIQFLIEYPQLQQQQPNQQPSNNHNDRTQQPNSLLSSSQHHDPLLTSNRSSHHGTNHQLDQEKQQQTSSTTFNTSSSSSTIASYSVYLMDQQYMKKWLLWAYDTHSPSPASSSSSSTFSYSTAATATFDKQQQEEKNKMYYMVQEGLYYISILLGYTELVPDPSTRKNHIHHHVYTSSSNHHNHLVVTNKGPGPIDNTALSQLNQPLLLDNHVQILQQQIPSSSKDPITSGMNHLSISHNHNNKNNTNNKKECVVVPESFYEILRRFHGVVCDDDASISFQPFPSPTTSTTTSSNNNNNNTTTTTSSFRSPLFDDYTTNTMYHNTNHQQQNKNSSPGQSENFIPQQQQQQQQQNNNNDSFILQHFLYPVLQNSNNKNNNGVKTRGATQPRPVEFRRKVIHQIDYEKLNDIYSLNQQHEHENNENVNNKNKNDVHHHPLNKNNKKSSKDQQNKNKKTKSLMEQLLFEEHKERLSIIPPIILAVELYPIKLIYRYHTSDTQQQQQRLNHHHHSANNNNNKVGFILVPSSTNAFDVLAALIRIAEPTKASQNIRLWSKWTYYQEEQEEDKVDPHEKDVVHNPSGRSNNKTNKVGIPPIGAVDNKRVVVKTLYPTQVGDGYELVNLRQLLHKKKKITPKNLLSDKNHHGKQNGSTSGMMTTTITTTVSPPTSSTTQNQVSSQLAAAEAATTIALLNQNNDRITIGEWVHLHHLNRMNQLDDVAYSIDYWNKYYSHALGTNNITTTSSLATPTPTNTSCSHNNEMELLIETRRTMNTTIWPRDSYTLINRLKVGDYIDARDVAGKWYEGMIRQMEHPKNERISDEKNLIDTNCPTIVVDDDAQAITTTTTTYITVHFFGWASKWDTKIPINNTHRNILLPNNDHSSSPNTRNNTVNLDTKNTNGQDSIVHHQNEFISTTTTPKVNHTSNQGKPSTPKDEKNASSSKMKPPEPLWSHTGRWREQIQVNDIVEVRDTSSLAEHPKWYMGKVRRIGKPNEPIRDMTGGAELELYPVGSNTHRYGENDGTVSHTVHRNNGTSIRKKKNGLDRGSNILIGGDLSTIVSGESKNGLRSQPTDEEPTVIDSIGTDKTELSTFVPLPVVHMAPLLLLGRTQQVLVEVEQERPKQSKKLNLGGTPNGSSNNNNSMERKKNHGISESDNKMDNSMALVPQPPYLRWVSLYGEEICKLGTHLNPAVVLADDALSNPVSTKKTIAPVTLTYEYESYRKPVEIMKQSHPMHGSGFMRESLRGVPPAPGSVGLHNLGNSCFLNSTVQCLSHIQPITQYFVEDRYTKDLNKDNPLGSGGNVSIAFASLLKKIWAGHHSILVPRLLKQTVASFAPQFDNSYQHDSHEFCQFLMDGLHEDLNRVKKKPYVEELECFGMNDSKAAIESWRKHLLRHDSIIVDHCQGMHRSHLTCPQCGRESIKFDVYSSISLPVMITEKNKTSIHLAECIEKFMEAEQLDERDAYYCPNCRRHVCALKLIALWTVPDVLIIHLKRFTFDTCMTSGGMLRSKIDHTVEFPINGMDLTKIVLGPVDPNAPPIYNLFGVSEHTGPTANSGHYTATVRNSIDGQWYRCNDSHVGRTSGEAAITGGAYLLFYQRAKGLTKWGGLAKAMKERNINPYGSLDIDADGFIRVVKKKKNKN